MQAIAVPFLNNSILISYPLFLENKEEKAKEPGKLGLAMVEKGNNLCAQFSLFCKGKFYNAYNGEQLVGAPGIKTACQSLGF